jgi:hypothetical protein
MRLYPRVTHSLPTSNNIRSRLSRHQFEREQQQTTQQKAVKETFIEPDVKWKESKAKRLLYKDIVEGKVPPDATDADRLLMKPT